MWIVELLQASLLIHILTRTSGGLTIVRMREQYEKQVQEACPTDIENESPDRMFFDLLAKSYIAYMSRPPKEPDNFQLEKDLELDFREQLFF